MVRSRLQIQNDRDKLVAAAEKVGFTVESAPVRLTGNAEKSWKCIRLKKGKTWFGIVDQADVTLTVNKLDIDIPGVEVKTNSRLRGSESKRLLPYFDNGVGLSLKCEDCNAAINVITHISK